MECSSVKSADSVAVSGSTRDVPSRIDGLSQVSGVLGCQWGDEGKGKLVDVLAQHFDVVARCQVLFLSLIGGNILRGFCDYPLHAC